MQVRNNYKNSADKYLLDFSDSFFINLEIVGTDTKSTILTKELYSGFAIDCMNEVPDPFMILIIGLLTDLLAISEIRD